MMGEKLIDNRPIEERVSEIVHAASAAIAHLNQSSHGEAQMATFFCVEIAVDVEDGVMLDGGAHRRATEPCHGAGDRHVVALGAAAGEHDLVRSASEHGGDAIA